MTADSVPSKKGDETNEIPHRMKGQSLKRLLETEKPSINYLIQDLDIPEVTLYYWDRQIENDRSRLEHS
jgi:hypothetical protein